jgi:hypothetical protein
MSSSEGAKAATATHRGGRSIDELGWGSGGGHGGLPGRRLVPLPHPSATPPRLSSPFRSPSPRFAPKMLAPSAPPTTPNLSQRHAIEVPPDHGRGFSSRWRTAHRLPLPSWQAWLYNADCSFTSLHGCDVPARENSRCVRTLIATSFNCRPLTRLLDD